MPYLTFEEYKEFGFTDLEEEKFNKLIRKASDVIDAITRFFYQFNNIDDDVKFRRNQFKKAVGAQVEYFNDIGGTTFEGINNAPQTFQAGRTAVSNTSRFNSGGKNESKSLVAEDVWMYLAETGLLYRGVDVRG